MIPERMNPSERLAFIHLLMQRNKNLEAENKKLISNIITFNKIIRNLCLAILRFNPDSHSIKPILEGTKTNLEHYNITFDNKEDDPFYEWPEPT